MAKKPFNIGPQKVYFLIMLIQLIVLLTMLISEFEPAVFLLYLIIVFSMVLRWRVDLKPVYMLIDQIIFMIIAVFYPFTLIFLFIYGYYFAYKNKLLYIIPSILIGILTAGGSVYYLLLLQAVLFGTILYHWEEESNSSKAKIDHLRQQVYSLESIQAQLLADYQDTEKISRLTERQRIAENLHDNLGHELTAAHLSLKAYKTLLVSSQLKKADETLDKAEQRLGNALEELKDSVMHIEPVNKLGLADLNNLCENYIYPVNFKHSGDPLKLKPYVWQLIMMSVKEALTNTTKHAHPREVNIMLEVTDYIVRLMIENDGLKNNKEIIHKDIINGNGIRYMRKRLEAINGSLSIQIQDTFKLIIIIPIQKN